MPYREIVKLSGGAGSSGEVLGILDGRSFDRHAGAFVTKIEGYCCGDCSKIMVDD